MSAGLYLTEVNINTVCELGGGAVSLQVCSSRARFVPLATTTGKCRACSACSCQLPLRPLCALS